MTTPPATGMDEAAQLAQQFEAQPLPALLAQARALARSAHGALVSYSRKVFIPLTRLCRDSCAYCTFATVPSRLPRAFLTPEQVLEIARAGQAAGCREALFTLGDKPELRYDSAREELAQLGYASTVDYLAAMCALVLRETALLPHVNAGVMPREDIARLREVSISQGLMLESVSERLCARGGPHFGSPDKQPAARLAMLEAAGELAVPFTTGILIGIGETRAERIAALLAIRDLHRRHGHVQEVIVQNFRAKPGTRMAGCEEPGLDDLLWTAAAARLVLGAAANIQVPPNLSDRHYPRLLEAGINDWGGISPVTPDHVNPEAAWPAIAALARSTRDAGLTLVERLAVYPAYCGDADRWLAPPLAARVRREVDAEGLPRSDAWVAGDAAAPPARPRAAARGTADAWSPLRSAIARAQDGQRLDEAQIARLFSARDDAFDAVCEAADALRRATVSDTVGYVVNRNINYTNICQHACRFCAFAKGRGAEDLRGQPYDLDAAEIARRVAEAWQRGATEVCMQGGIHPAYTGDTYVELCRIVKGAQPSMHVHAFSPLEILHGARTTGMGLAPYLRRLREAGLGTLPGTAAEILDDEVRAVICPDKLNTAEWLEVMETAHGVGLRSTATMMFGHVERPLHWARHLLRIRDLQQRTGGFTEFVPLPFVHREAPMHRKGLSRRGPTWREAVLVHAVARLVLHPLVPHVQASWVKMGRDGVRACLQAGASDLGGTLMNESISRAAGTVHGQELPPADMEALIRAAGRQPRQRTTLYADAPAGQRETSYAAAPLAAVVLTPPRRRSSAAPATDRTGVPA
ncbi:5-amino-6-(D-ribitylamino)uracil--L-tyrosine 4-hydroxyphenyl transferase CofH [Pseudorhodoferax sp.]|uniref:5-amino-6-(D-ribitylamino)uracil--L-tyrosine 4-hydroxyphenyl transferase CofH n=1 Tax=Pseudorhodoferax sp. TaxID=1993553 RepID=UPI0039E46A82